MADVVRSDALRHLWLEAAAKFDYFVLGAVLALIGYGAETLAVSPIAGLGANEMELTALTLLLAAAICGFLRIELALQAIKANAHFVWFGELAQGHQAERSLIQDDDLEELLSRLDDRWKSSQRWAMGRNTLLFLGLTGMVAARVMAAYGR